MRDEPHNFSTTNVNSSTERDDSRLHIHLNGKYQQNPSGTITLGHGDQIEIFHGGLDGSLPLMSTEMLTQTLINQHQFAKMKIMQ